MDLLQLIFEVTPSRIFAEENKSIHIQREYQYIHIYIYRYN